MGTQGRRVLSKYKVQKILNRCILIIQKSRICTQKKILSAFSTQTLIFHQELVHQSSFLYYTFQHDLDFLSHLFIQIEACLFSPAFYRGLKRAEVKSTACASNKNKTFHLKAFCATHRPLSLLFNLSAFITFQHLPP